MSVEALDELARIALAGQPDREARVAKIEQITNDGMDGKIGFGESLVERLALFQPSRHHIDELVILLKGHVTQSIAENRQYLVDNADRIYIMSGGFREYIMPVVEQYGIPGDHILANTFVRNSGGFITGCDQKNPLSQDGGKVAALKSLELSGQVIMLGDGYSDYLARVAGAADEFVAFVENVDRKSVTERADYVAHDFGFLIGMIEPSDTMVV